MKPTLVLASITLLAAGAGHAAPTGDRASRTDCGATAQATPHASHAGPVHDGVRGHPREAMHGPGALRDEQRAAQHEGREHRRGRRGDAGPACQADSYEHGMHAVSHSAAAGEPGHGWRYFSNPAARRAVVISPNGEYYFSGGDGLRPVAGTPSGA